MKFFSELYDLPFVVQEPVIKVAGFSHGIVYHAAQIVAKCMIESSTHLLSSLAASNMVRKMFVSKIRSFNSSVWVVHHT